MAEVTSEKAKRVSTCCKARHGAKRAMAGVVPSKVQGVYTSMRRKWTMFLMMCHLTKKELTEAGEEASKVIKLGRQAADVDEHHSRVTVGRKSVELRPDVSNFFAERWR